MPPNEQTRDSYHHGNLPDTLIEEGAQLLAEVGIDGFSLRKLAQRAGVTVAAPSHHFGSVRGLLTAIATKGFERLTREMHTHASSAQGPGEAVLSMCLAYLEAQTKDVGYAIVMFRLDLLDVTDQRFRANAFDAFGLLEGMLRRALPEKTQASQISATAKALWATTHGLGSLPMIENAEVEQVLRCAIAAHLGEHCHEAFSVR